MGFKNRGRSRECCSMTLLHAILGRKSKETATNILQSWQFSKPPLFQKYLIRIYRAPKGFVCLFLLFLFSAHASWGAGALFRASTAAKSILRNVTG